MTTTVHLKDLPSPEQMMLLARLYETGSLAKAADDLGMSLSSANRRLAELRVRMDDPLFLRSGTGLTATAKMEAVAQKLFPLLTQMQDLLTSPQFSPATLKRTFRILCTDNTFTQFVAPVVETIYAAAPRVEIEIVPLRQDSLSLLRDRKADFAICTHLEPMNGIVSTVIGRRNTYQLLMRRDHPLACRARAGEAVTVQDLARWPMAVHPRYRQLQFGSTTLLSAQAMHKLRVPYFNAVIPLLEASDCIAWTTGNTAAHWLRTGRFYALDLAQFTRDRRPVTFESHLLWARSEESNPAMQWMRSILLDAALHADDFVGDSE